MSSKTQLTTFDSIPGLVQVLPGIIVFLYVLFSEMYQTFLFFSTKKEKSFKIKDKFMYVNQYYTNFMVVDENNNCYKITNTFLGWNFNRFEMYGSLEVGKMYNFKFYGYKNTLFSMYPNIIQVIELEEDIKND